MLSKPSYQPVDVRQREGLAKFVRRTFSQVRFGLGPLWTYLGAVTVFGAYVGYRAFNKPDVYFNRANPTDPLQWERAKEHFGQSQRIVSDKPANWRRIPELDSVMEEMEAAERKL